MPLQSQAPTKSARFAVGAPSQHNQPSRKGKKAWRKNVDLQEVEEGFEELRVEERATGTFLHKQQDDFDDPAEEKIRLMQDVKRLDEDVLDGLVRGLKIPAPSLTNPSAVKEILFPANLIRLVTNEMWKYGLILESERFLANVLQTIQGHVMSFTGEEAIVPGIFWLSNAHEMLSFICVVESDMLQGIGPGEENAVRSFDWNDYERLVCVVKHDLDTLEYNIYHTWMLETKKKLSKMVIPALIESQSLPGFTTSDGGGWLFKRLWNANTAPAYSMDDILNMLNKIWKSLKSYYMEESVVQQVITELLKLIGTTSFNDLMMRRNFSSWKRGKSCSFLRCKSHDMPEGTLHLERLMQATKLLQLKKATAADIEIIYDVCWTLSPMQIQRMFTNYYVADYENPISPEILKVVASRVQANRELAQKPHKPHTAFGHCAKFPGFGSVFLGSWRVTSSPLPLKKCIVYTKVIISGVRS
ncbi:DIL domain-containing protein [Mycena galopus ATCC 62051]|nr:DIL domain-containing protein [Mycena galopus ATCC 62051]